MIGVIIPVHNEEALLHDCLSAIEQAAAHPLLCGEPVRIVVVLDSCSDGSAAVAARFNATIITINQRNVGFARHTGAAWLLQQGARWLANTDADSLVPEDWLVEQIHAGAEAVCGTVRVAVWDEHPEHVRHRYLELYQQCEGHRHIHGANLGICARAYQRAGGFSHLVAHEDVTLVRALEAIGARITWTARNTVCTSARKLARAPNGFSEYLNNLAAVS